MPGWCLSPDCGFAIDVHLVDEADAGGVELCEVIFGFTNGPLSFPF